MVRPLLPLKKHIKSQIFTSDFNNSGEMEFSAFYNNSNDQLLTTSNLEPRASNHEPRTPNLEPLNFRTSKYKKSSI